MAGTHSPGGGRPPIDIINGFSDTASQVGIILPGTQKQIDSGALIADTYASILSISSGSGVIKSLAFASEDTTSRTIGMRITIDGVEIVDQVSSAITTEGHGIIAFGSFDSGGLLLDTGNEIWKSSLLIEVKSSLSETDKINMYITYYLT